MNEYLKQFLNVIRNCSVDNTYKMSWAKALVEISFEKPNNPKIELKQIAIKMFKYYWNQSIYFDLIQGSNLSKPPEFISVVKYEIAKYYEKSGTKQPVLFERIENEIELDYIKLVRVLKKDVSWRFLKLKNEIVPLYNYQQGDDTLTLESQDVLAEYSDVLFESINFRWTQILENFNSSPRIAKKVRVLDLGEIKRSSLSKYRVFLDTENPNHTCFVCEKNISDETLSIDHVIPWSFMFSDDLWNLVYTHKSCNSQKSNIIPLEAEIEALEIRNDILFSLLQSTELEGKKPTKELGMAIEKDFVQKFWINCKT